MQGYSLDEQPFKIWLRREQGYDDAAAVRFELTTGRAVLSLRIPDRRDPDPTAHFEEINIPIDALTGGRFIEVLPGGNRRSYALSRLTADVVGKLPAGHWVELEGLTEYGFRYLVFSDKVQAQIDASASVAAPTSEATPKAPRPRPVANVSTPAAPEARQAAGQPRSPRPSGAPQSNLPPRQAPMDPRLAHETLSRLSHNDALGYLQAEMAKVEALHKHVDELSRLLQASQERERDLLQLLQRWQSRG